MLAPATGIGSPCTLIHNASLCCNTIRVPVKELTNIRSDGLVIKLAAAWDRRRRLGATKGACVLRGRGAGVVIDGPFTQA